MDTIKDQLPVDIIDQIYPYLADYELKDMRDFFQQLEFLNLNLESVRTKVIKKYGLDEPTEHNQLCWYAYFEYNGPDVFYNNIKSKYIDYTDNNRDRNVISFDIWIQNATYFYYQDEIGIIRINLNPDQCYKLPFTKKLPLILYKNIKRIYWSTDGIFNYQLGYFNTIEKWISFKKNLSSHDDDVFKKSYYNTYIRNYILKGFRKKLYTELQKLNIYF